MLLPRTNEEPVGRQAYVGLLLRISIINGNEQARRQSLTRSQTVDRIADRTESQQTI